MKKIYIGGKLMQDRVNKLLNPREDTQDQFSECDLLNDSLK